MKSCARLIEEGKLCVAAGTGLRVSDKVLGERMGGFAQQTIAKAKNGQMSDAVALALGELLVKHGRIEHAGEVLLIAHAERDSDPKVRRALMDYAKKVVGRLPEMATSALLAFVVAVGTLMPARDAQAIPLNGGAAKATASATWRRWWLRLFFGPPPVVAA